MTDNFEVGVDGGRIIVRATIPAAAFLIFIVGLNLACSKGTVEGDTTFREAEKGFENEMTTSPAKSG